MALRSIGYVMTQFPTLPPVEALSVRQTTPDFVAEVLRDAILQGHLEDGQELNQVALADHFSVSRVPIREALRQLQAEGLVRQEAHRRAVVTTLTPARIMELFDVRIRLETYMLERTIGQVDEETMLQLEDMLEEMRDTEDHSRWLHLNRGFHNLMYEKSGAEFTLELADQIGARTTRYLYIASGGEGIDRVDEADAEHSAILDAIRGEDAERALSLLVSHIEGTRVQVAEFLDSRLVEPFDPLHSDRDRAGSK